MSQKRLEYKISMDVEEFDKALSQIEARLEKIEDKLSEIEEMLDIDDLSSTKGGRDEKG